MLGGFGKSAEQLSLTLVLESEAIAVDAPDNRVVKAPIEHGSGKNAVARERAIPTAEGQVRREDHGAAFVALGHDLEE